MLRSVSSCIAAVLLVSGAAALQLPAATSTRRAVLGGAALAVFAPPQPAPAATDAMASIPKPPTSDLLEELPPKAKQAYLQYLPQLQIDGDFFMFDLPPMVSQPGRWDLIYALTASTDIGSAASVSRLDREFVTPMRQIALSFPPDMGGEDMQGAIDDFQKAMFKLSQLARKGAQTGNTAGPSAAEIKEVEGEYTKARLGLNAFFAAVNEGTGAKRLVAVPNPTDKKAYPRSEKRYTQLLKDAALCRNRGGEVLAGVWGNLMVYGTVPGVNPCGSAAEKYYSQGL